MPHLLLSKQGQPSLLRISYQGIQPIRWRIDQFLLQMVPLCYCLDYHVCMYLMITFICALAAPDIRRRGISDSQKISHYSRCQVQCMANGHDRLWVIIMCIVCMHAARSPMLWYLVPASNSNWLHNLDSHIYSRILSPASPRIPMNACSNNSGRKIIDVRISIFPSKSSSMVFAAMSLKTRVPKISFNPAIRASAMLSVSAATLPIAPHSPKIP
jgi:hypothetical protein